MMVTTMVELLSEYAWPSRLLVMLRSCNAAIVPTFACGYTNNAYQQLLFPAFSLNMAMYLFHLMLHQENFCNHVVLEVTVQIANHGLQKFVKSLAPCASVV